MKKFYLGMDIGTNSVGMACTDENYRLLRAKGKDCWAVRLFDASSTAEERRLFRTARRRLERRKQRLGFLQALFAPYLADKNFFIRLNNSPYYADDKADILGGDKNALFADGGYTDKNYHAEFPTIYHLRNKLQNEPVEDLRLYYLALHHIVKYRGHFLTEGGMEEVRDAQKLFGALNAVCAERYAENEDVPYFDLARVPEAKECLLDGKKGMRDIQLALEALFGKDALTKEIIKGICGATLSPKKLFGEEYKEEKSFSFKKLTDEACDAMQAVYGDDFAVLEAIRAIYGYIVFEKLLEGQPNISCAMIRVYENHKRDLRLLKDFLRTNASEETYRRFFKSAKEKANYVNYVGYTKKGGDKIKVKPCRDEDFFAELKKLLLGLENVKDAGLRDEMVQKIETNEFLPKILHSDNGLFPHQVNEEELNKIVAAMVKTHPETAEIADKILPVFLFRIPYYVGPLTGKNSWVVRSAEKITPWNFDEAVDKALSNEQFMRNMTNKCTYLHSEDVLPQASIYYQKFDVLNQINKLRIDDRPISVPLKKRLFDELFLKRKRVTDKALLDFLVRSGEISEAQKSSVKITGKDGELKANMGSYIRLKEILGEFVDEDLAKGGGVCENIILWHTLNTDKNIVVDLIERNYGRIPVIKAHIKQLKGLSFQKFGRLSKKFLTDLRVKTEETGAGLSVLDLLYETNDNLNEILFRPEYRLEERIREENGEECGEITYKDVEKLYVSPVVRRGIWQSLVMVDEYVQAIGRVPDKIFIEVTREEGQKGEQGRTQSRKSRLLSCYKNMQGYEDLLEELQQDEITDMRLRQERLYLYFRQLGRCMYTGERIDLSALNTDRYDVDHILPRCYIKDDSLDNKVLVSRAKNAEKRDLYPLPQGFSAQQPFWRLLLQKNLISDRTYMRLTRIEPLGDNDYNDFISRQKTITDQTVKAVAELLKRKYPQTKIVYSRAKNVSDFRQKFKLFKCRVTNDLHHAKDAYLNVVVGNVFDICFSAPWGMYRQAGDEWRTYNLKTMFHRDVAGAWDKDGSIAVVKQSYAKSSMAVTRYAYCEKGGFYDLTVYAHDDASITAPRKGKGALSNTQRYGGYKSQKTAYFAIVQSLGKKGKPQKTIEAVPVLVQEQCRDDEGKLRDYFERCGLKNAVLLVPKIKCKQLVSYNGTPVYITGISKPQVVIQNAVQLFADNQTDEYVKALAEFSERFGGKNGDRVQEVYVIKTNRMGEVHLTIDREKNCALYDRLIAKLENKIYGGLSICASYLATLKNGRNKFIGLPVAEQAQVLLNILDFFHCNAKNSDLTLIGGAKNAGSFAFNKDITNVDFRLIYQSPCGLIVRERKV
ncbi:MAG: type II CRISPR RNA-guided endonuclease Cas9 [Clostridia bacterium]|jgi:CRISPR-associated endonuclease Csn1|nr:type II CRISPR RNA-guided endonuclease Cas9 [Clostridia bacterium]